MASKRPSRSIDMITIVFTGFKSAAAFTYSQGAEDVAGRSHENVACSLVAVPVAKQPCGRVVQLLLLYACIVMFAAFAVAGAGDVHSKYRRQKTRYQRGKASSIQAFVMAEHDGDGRLTPNEVRTFDDLKYRGADEGSATRRWARQHKYEC